MEESHDEASASASASSAGTTRHADLEPPTVQQCKPESWPVDGWVNIRESVLEGGMPRFTNGHIVGYFVKREVGADHDAESDVSIDDKAVRLFDKGHVQESRYRQ